MSESSYIKWTEEEWASVATRAAALHASKPEMSWGLIAVVSQDEIAPDRRRPYFNKPSALRPLFDKLGLDEQGSPKPVLPPPPPSEPEAPLPPPDLPAPLVLDKVPTSDLFAEVFKRGEEFKGVMQSVLKLDESIRAMIQENNAKLEAALKRVDEVEGQVLKSMEGMDQINAAYAEIRKLAQEAAAKEGGPPVNPDMPKALSRIAPMRVLLIGPFPKDVPRIRERLPKHANIDLILGENSENTRLPTNVHYALVSGHHDFERRWQLVRDTYGPTRARRLENGAIGTYANIICQLLSELP
jgi:hypothetical protein